MKNGSRRTVAAALAALAAVVTVLLVATVLGLSAQVALALTRGHPEAPLTAIEQQVERIVVPRETVQFGGESAESAKLRPDSDKSVLSVWPDRGWRRTSASGLAAWQGPHARPHAYDLSANNAATPLSQPSAATPSGSFESTGSLVDSVPLLVTPRRLAAEGEGATSEELQQTAHGLERSLDPSRLSIADQQNVIANATQEFTQGDNADVYVQQVGDRYNVVVQGENGVITNLRGISASSLSRLASNYGWVPK